MNFKLKVAAKYVIADPSDSGQSMNNRGRHLYDAKGDQAEEKDLWRMRDMKTRSKGDDNKLVQLAQQMANSIKDENKARRRADAAAQVFSGNVKNKIVKIFEDKTNSL